MLKRIDHVVIAVKDLKAATAIYEKQFGLKATEPKDVPALGIRNVKLQLGNAFIELAEPTDPNGPVGKFVNEKGDGLYLISIEVDSLKSSMESLKSKGARLIGEDNAAKSGIVFVHPKSTHGALIQLMEKKS